MRLRRTMCRILPAVKRRAVENLRANTFLDTKAASCNNFTSRIFENGTISITSKVSGLIFKQKLSYLLICQAFVK